MRILILGAGALGILFGGIMSKHGGEVVILTRRRDAAAAICSQGVVVEEGSSSWMAQPTCTTDPRVASEADVCLICVKSYDTSEVAGRVSRYLHPDCLMITVQNGLGNVERLVEIFGPERVVAGYTLQSSTLMGINRVFHAYDGETVLGGHPSTSTDIKRVRGVAEEFTRLGVKTAAVADVFPDIVTKLIINSVINPLTALLKLKNGDLLAFEPLHDLMEGLIEEGVDAATLLGVNLSKADVRKRVYEAVEATALNKSSMLQDIENCRRTEIEFINGALSNILQGAGRPAFYNTVLTRLIKALEERCRKHEGRF